MRSVTGKRVWTIGLAAASVMLLGTHCHEGLDVFAFFELHSVGLDKYQDEFDPTGSTDVGDGWTRHDFDTEGGDGPICIAGTPYSVFSRLGDPKKLLIFEQGGGACWQDFYNCNVLAEDQAPPFPRGGVWDFDSPENPFADYSIVYLPYCDGSVFAGDNDVPDESFPFGPVRFHRGLRNQTAGIDVARDLFPAAKEITVAGSSAGGVGATGFAPFLVRFAWGNRVELTVFNDAGPVAVNLDVPGDIAIRAADWQFGQFYPPSCTACSDMGQATAVIQWRLDRDRGIREAFYETDGDLTNRFFLGLLGDQPKFREIVVTEHGAINAAHPDRYKRFIVAGDTSHTSFNGSRLYTQDANGIVLSNWVADFLVDAPGWVDVVEDAVP